MALEACIKSCGIISWLTCGCCSGHHGRDCYSDDARHQFSDWICHPSSVMWTFVISHCAKERYAIIKLTYETRNLSINKCNEVERQLQHWWVRKDKRVAATQLYHFNGKLKLQPHSPFTLTLTLTLTAEPTLGPNDPVVYLLGKAIPRSRCPLPPYLKSNLTYHRYNPTSTSHHRNI